jgi:hypothetical protein
MSLKYRRKIERNRWRGGGGSVTTWKTFHIPFYMSTLPTLLHDSESRAIKTGDISRIKSVQMRYHNQQEVLWRTNRLLSFRCNFSVDATGRTKLWFICVIKSVEFERLQCWYYWWETPKVRRWAGIRWHDIYHTKINEVISRFCLRNLRGCNVGITDVRNLLCMSMRWLHMAWCKYQDSWRMVQVFKQC